MTGGGSLKGEHGQFDLKVAKLDLNAIQSSLRADPVRGPIGITLAGDTQTITLDLNDPKAAIRAQGKVKLDAKQTTFEGVKLSVGKGRVELSGALKKDVNSSYDLKAKLVEFNPLLLCSRWRRAGQGGKGKKPRPRA